MPFTRCSRCSAIRQHDTTDEQAWYEARRARPHVGDLFFEDCEACIADVNWLDWLARVLPHIPATGLPDGAFGDLEWLRGRTVNTCAYEGALQAASIRDLRASVAEFTEKFPGVIPESDVADALPAAPR